MQCTLQRPQPFSEKKKENYRQDQWPDRPVPAIWMTLQKRNVVCAAIAATLAIALLSSGTASHMCLTEHESMSL